MPHTSYIPDMTNAELKELGQSVYDWVNNFFKEAETQEKSEGEWGDLGCMEMQLDTIVDELFIRQHSWFLKRHTPKKLTFRVEYEVYDIFDKLIETAEKDFKACTIDDAIEDAEIYLSEVFNTDSSACIVGVSCPDEDKWYGTEDYYPSC